MQVFVSGEISNLTVHGSGHIYFSIKDETSTISCVMFKGNTKYLKFQLENGQKVQVLEILQFMYQEEIINYFAQK